MTIAHSSFWLRLTNNLEMLFPDIHILKIPVGGLGALTPDPSRSLPVGIYCSKNETEG